MANTVRISSLATAQPPFEFPQDYLANGACERMLGAGWERDPERAERGRQLIRLFEATRVRTRQFAVNLPDYYAEPRTTGQRMAAYGPAALALASAAFAATLERGAEQETGAASVSDLVVVSCTGYTAPGLDILLARDFGLPRDLRRVCVGHMGCYGALVGLRQGVAAVRANPGAVAGLVSVELSSLHFTDMLDVEALTAYALFGDAAASLLLTSEPEASGPEVVDMYCAADFAAAGQMSWTIGDTGFVMGLSPRIPVTLRRAVGGVLDNLLAPHGLTVRDVTHWMVHPGGPAILEAVAGKLELSAEQMAPSWDVLARHGNCSSATVLLILDDILRSGRAKPGDYGVMMAFGPGLTLETCLLLF
ncbi:MAG: type III polyketide synthase [Ktedonobacterales bacterium]